jgi:K+-transporting ATPase A subunit
VLVVVVAANSNGSAFAGLAGKTTFYNVALAIVMLLGRYLPMVFVLGWPEAWHGRSRWRSPWVICAPTARCSWR